MDDKKKTRETLNDGGKGTWGHKPVRCVLMMSKMRIIDG